MNNDTTTIQQIKDKKLDEAKKSIEDLVDGEWTPVERGAVQTGLLRAYVETNNAVTDEYIATLEESADLLNKINVSRRKVNDALKIHQVKKDLAA